MPRNWSGTSLRLRRPPPSILMAFNLSKQIPPASLKSRGLAGGLADDLGVVKQIPPALKFRGLADDLGL